jgi:capsular exopolysaccharide synthesis family protein
MEPGTESMLRAIELKKELAGVQIEFEQNERLMKSLGPQLEAQRSRGTVGDTKYGLGEKIAELQRENRVLGVRRQTIKRVIDDLMNSQDPHAEQRVYDLRKKTELEYSLFQELKHELFQIQMQRIVVRNRVRSLEKARDFEVRPSVSLPRKLAIAFIVALLIGGPAAYAWELMVPTIKSRQDVDDANLVFLGGVPDLSRAARRKHKAHFVAREAEYPLMCRFDVDSPGSLAFKHIRTRILHLSEATQSPIQVVTILGSTMGEGKSFVARHIAACIAHMKKRVLLIDCDLRRAGNSDYFHLRTAHGLGDALSGGELFGALVRKGILGSFDLLPAGTYSSGVTELLASDRWGELIRDLRALYDFIIIDTPPLIPPPDAALASKHADMLVMVASARRTTREKLDFALDNLLDLNHKRVYAILNRVEGLEDSVYVIGQPAITAGRNSGEKVTNL